MVSVILNRLLPQFLDILILAELLARHNNFTALAGLVAVNIRHLARCLLPAIRGGFFILALFLGSLLLWLAVLVQALSVVVQDKVVVILTYSLACLVAVYIVSFALCRYFF